MSDSAMSVNWKDKIDADTNVLSRRGMLLFGSILGLFVIWATFAPIAGGVLSSGRIVAMGQNQLLQHPNGGVVKSIILRDGDRVKKGDLIAVIDPTLATAEVVRLKSRRLALLARKARLTALKNGGVIESEDAANGVFAGLRRGSDDTSQNAASDGVLQEQMRELKASVERLNSQRQSLTERLETLESELASNQAQYANTQNSVQLIDEQLKRIRPLVADGFVAQSQLWDLENRRLDTASRAEALDGSVGSLMNQIEAAKSDLSAFEAEQAQIESRELSEVLEELASLDQLVDAAENQLAYAELRAPLDGVLTKMAIFTEGGVVSPGEVIAEIVPSDGTLEAEVRLPITDIKRVDVGTNARVTIASFDAGQSQPVDGVVSYVAADSSIDAQTGEVYFTARVELKPSENERFRMQPGMLADAVIGEHSRSFFAYMLEPIGKSFSKAFREG